MHARAQIVHALSLYTHAHVYIIHVHVHTHMQPPLVFLLSAHVDTHTALFLLTLTADAPPNSPSQPPPAAPILGQVAARRGGQGGERPLPPT